MALVGRRVELIQGLTCFVAHALTQSNGPFRYPCFVEANGVLSKQGNHCPSERKLPHFLALLQVYGSIVIRPYLWQSGTFGIDDAYYRRSFWRKKSMPGYVPRGLPAIGITEPARVPATAMLHPGKLICDFMARCYSAL